jgi:hypothetical protein
VLLAEFSRVFKFNDYIKSRAKRASARNFELVKEDDKKNIYYLHGKVI